MMMIHQECNLLQSISPQLELTFPTGASCPNKAMDYNALIPHPIRQSKRQNVLIPHLSGKATQKSELYSRPLVQGKVPKASQSPTHAPCFPGLGGWGFTVIGA